MNRPMFPNWGDHPVVVLIVVLAALVSILVAVHELRPEYGSSSSSESISAESIESPPEREEPVQQGPVIQVLCNEPNTADNGWSWHCRIENHSTEAIRWEDAFGAEGARLHWFCLGDAQGCHSNALGDELILGDNGDIRFNFLNPEESFDFWIRCPEEPGLCYVNGRAPDLTINGAHFQRMRE